MMITTVRSSTLLLPLVCVAVALLKTGSVSSWTAMTTKPTRNCVSQLFPKQQQRRLRPTSSSPSSLFVATDLDVQSGTEDVPIPEIGKEGVYHLTNEGEFRALMNANTDKLVILKVFAPWCKACKGLEPKFNALVKDEKYKNLPIVWASFTIQNNKEFVKSIGVLALPTIQFYARGQRMETFACGPSKVPILKRKLVQFVNDNVDATTYELKEVVGTGGPPSSTATTTTDPSDSVSAAAAAGQQQQQQQQEQPSTKETPEMIINRERSMLRKNKYLSELLESEFESLLAKATLLTFEAGSVIMREGNMGHRFYVILDGEVEICQRTSFEDPLTTPPSYLGTVINRQDEKGEYFGERALITGEPRAASIRASSRTTCLAFDKNDFPRTNVLSGFYVPEETLVEVNDKYMVDVGSSVETKQYQDSVKASQSRGSVNNPRVIDGVDNEMEITDEMIQEQIEQQKEFIRQQQQQSIGDGIDTTAGDIVTPPVMPSLGVSTEVVIPLLVRLKLIREITRCLDYMVENRLSFGDAGTRRRRAMLVNVLGPLQRQEIDDAFKLIDEDGDKEITLIELKRLLSSIGEERTDQELLEVIGSTHLDGMDDKKVMTIEDFTGLMAEAEIYYLFLDTFRAMDPSDTGFVRAKDLDRVLCGVRDLISDDRRSIIDVDDTEMMVDYEQFSRMLLGSALNP
mmetsp:Transcript_19156/g.46253  ORF Transcript_19156/g.46253 Transcript_19156/m.46253 type:complete len:686 (-) Transcript_19156:74-2131(-)